MLRSVVASSSSTPRMAGVVAGMTARRTTTANVGANLVAARTFVASCRASQASEAPQPPKMVKLTIDGKEIEVEQGTALIQACEKAGAQIPRFCYHERLLIAGNCRMCLVESKGAPKPLASCAFPAMPGQVITTNSPLVAKAREGVMEFLLANHPLDCPICDWGGECDLQDQSMRYGSDRSRMHEITGKRAVEDKNLGPLVKTVMTRCIHCTRCVRFANDVAGAQDLGTTGRGNQLQIGTYVEKMMDSEMSGNIVDLCPVGALTSKPYAFQARPWELKRTESVDVLDGVGSNIRVDSRGVQVVRILPRTNDDVNEEWINDKTRYASDGLKYQRLTSPFVKQGDRLVLASWPEAFSAIAEGLAASGAKGDEIKAVAGALADVESMVALKDLVNRLGSDNLTTDSPAGQLPPVHGVDFRSAYTMNTTISGIEHADALLLIGTNPRHEGAIINTRIRKAYLHQGLDVGLIGEASDLTYEYAHLGADAKALEDFVAGKGSEFAKKFKSAKKPMIIVGSAANEHVDGAAINGLLAKYLEAEKSRFFAPDWQGYNVLQRTASKVGAYDVGFVPTETASKTPAKFVYLLNADDFSPDSIPKDAFVVYQGHHGDLGAQYADVIVPGSAYTEKSTTFVNTEGRTQITRAAVPSPGAAREDWKIVRALSEVLGVTLPYDEVVDIRDRLFEISPTLVRYDGFEPVSATDLALAEIRRRVGNAKPSGAPLLRPISNFYMTDPISRASPTMAKCTSAFVHKIPMPEEDGRPFASLG